MRPSISRNELAWLATLEDVECRIVFTEHASGRRRYRVESGPFDTGYLQALPKRDWSLLVHDVDKHLPAMRRLFAQVPFIPDWRIDDLMISFAAPGGGVGPHQDNYDVFLCQGIGVREWHVSTDAIREDPKASEDLALLEEFDHGEMHLARKGDVLYLPPGVAHWHRTKGLPYLFDTYACTNVLLGPRFAALRSPGRLYLAASPPSCRHGRRETRRRGHRSETLVATRPAR